MELYANTYPTTYNSMMGIVPGESPVSSLSQKKTVALSKTEEKVTLSQEGKDKASRFSFISQTKDSSTNRNPKSLEQQELAQLQKLQDRDIEVRTHEQAHLSAAGPYAKGGASFTFQKGADGKSYAIGGEVGIDVSKESTPEATITKMQTIKRAALAPANPSAADRQIASQATVNESEARKNLLLNRQEELLQEAPAENPLATKRDSSTNNNSGSVSPSYSNLSAKLAIYTQTAA